jgi:3-methyladenine DNA glycosylase AlkD
MMNYYQEILKTITGLEGKGDEKEREWVQRYLGSNKPTRCIKTGDIKKLAADFIKKNKLGKDEYFKLIKDLIENAKTFEEIDVAAKILGNKNDYRKEIKLDDLGYWLTFTHGWAEGDVISQSNFEAEELLNRWNEWEKFLTKMNRSKNIQQRRASLVLLCKTLRQSDEEKVYDLAIKLANNLKSEKEILITKAVSWVLRSAVKNHKNEVEKYIEENKETLPKVAYKETLNKVQTGKKYSRIEK